MHRFRLGRRDGDDEIGSRLCNNMYLFRNDYGIFPWYALLKMSGKVSGPVLKGTSQESADETEDDRGTLLFTESSDSVFCVHFISL